MSTEVFKGLVQMIVETYLDDLIVPARTDQECIDRLEVVFKRLEEKHDSSP